MARTTKASTVKARTGEKKRSLKAEIIGIALFALALLFGVSLFFFHLDATGFVGLLGNNVAWILFSAIGYSAYAFPILFAFLGFELVFRQGFSARFSIPVSLALLVVSISGLLVIITGEATSGGIVGRLSASNLELYLGPFGSFIILFAVFLIAVRVGTGISLLHFAKSAGLILFIVVKWSYARAVRSAVFVLDKKKGLKKSPEERAKLEKEALKEQHAKELEEFKKKKKTPMIVRQAAEEKPKVAAPVQEKFEFAEATGTFRLPETDLLTPKKGAGFSVDKETLLTNSKILEKKLNDFDVQGQVLEVRPGPIVTMYEFEPAPGVKINKIVNLADDLALAMRAVTLRILAPIPGKAVVGIEVPNLTRDGILLREILESDEFKKNKSKLALAFGKGISGTPVVEDLAKMPHLLVAGATGAGKSVYVNALILSILYKSTPEDVRFLMIDPKMLELSAYEGIPHLLTPVITDVKRATGMLKNLVVEMEKRYRLMSEVGAKNIMSYNDKVVAEPTHNDTEHRKLPYIVVIIDELADLMMSSGKEVEESLVRLSQMARAAGIHLVLATQRPSVDVITGLIKANFPARVSFQVPSRIDSRTILDSGGAETLLGQGDMLFMPSGSAKLTRVHGAFVDEAEIKRITTYLKKQGKPSYDHEIAEVKAKAKGPGGEEYDDGFLKRYDDALKLISEMDTISTSYIQRRLRIGYNTAARIIEKMEADGVVGPQQGSKPREVLRRGG